ncbi:response regulator [Patescibacteria group bacterium]|nr:response regulator [Patescibacteria group bacterium]
MTETGQDQSRAPEKISEGVGVLVVDDEEQNAQILRRTIRKIFKGRIGIIDVAHSGRDALRLIEDNLGKYGIIFTDGNMPNGNGLELAREVKKRELGIDMVLISGGVGEYDLSSPQDVQEICSRYGISEVMQKPFAPSEIKRAIGDMLKKELRNWQCL